MSLSNRPYLHNKMSSHLAQGRFNYMSKQSVLGISTLLRIIPKERQSSGQSDLIDRFSATSCLFASPSTDVFTLFILLGS